MTQTKSLDLTSESVEAATLSIASAGLRGHLGLSVMTDHAKARVVERSLHDAPPLLRGEVYKVLYVLHLREQSTQGERVVTLKATPCAERRRPPQSCCTWCGRSPLFGRHELASSLVFGVLKIAVR